MLSTTFSDFSSGGPNEYDYQMEICGEYSPKFNKFLRGTYFVGDFDDESLEKYCQIRRLIFVAPFRPFLVLVSVELYYQEEWRGDIFEFAILNKSSVKQTPVYRTDMHESSGLGRFENIWLDFSQDEKEYYQVIVLNKTSERQDIKWNFRALITRVIKCPRGSRPLKNIDFSCECLDGYYEDGEKSVFTCSKLTANCRKGLDSTLCDECFQPYKLTKDKKCELHDSNNFFFLFQKF